ncbi:hypothetical protein [Actinomadura rayongensis]|uniref:hypothetical protein n=1 Tax=Actinomadura rayongensis TaxID=1429076 RepID=UPI001F1E8A89|nr:hypothetical protein [Actinomadura rayongensis]
MTEPMTPPPGVIITARDIYDKLVALGGKVDGMLTTFEQIRAQLADHEQRLRASERWRYALPLSVVLGLLSAVASIVAGLAGS